MKINTFSTRIARSVSIALFSGILAACAGADPDSDAAESTSQALYCGSAAQHAGETPPTQSYDAECTLGDSNEKVNIKVTRTCTWLSPGYISGTSYPGAADSIWSIPITWPASTAFGASNAVTLPLFNTIALSKLVNTKLRTRGGSFIDFEDRHSATYDLDVGRSSVLWTKDAAGTVELSKFVASSTGVRLSSANDTPVSASEFPNALALTLQACHAVTGNR